MTEADRLRFVAGLGFAALIAGATGALAQSPPPPIADRVRAYLTDYEPRLSALVADERFEQEVRRPPARRWSTNGLDSVRPGRNLRRVLQSEIGFLRLPGDLGWLAQRQVITVDGRAAGAAAGDLPALFARGGDTLLQAAARIAAHNATHNLGNPRSINVPTLPLELMDARHAAAFDVTAGPSAFEQGRLVQRVTFEEKPPGRLVAHSAKRFMRARVEALVVAATGAVLEADVTLDPQRPRVPSHRVTVEFGPQEGMAILVPARLIERFIADGEGSGVATYGNYRQFSTAARIVP